MMVSQFCPFPTGAYARWPGPVLGAAASPRHPDRRVLHRGAWVGIEVATTLIPVYGGSNTLERLAVGLILLGLPVVVTVSWLFDITPEGFRRDAGTGLAVEDPHAVAHRDIPALPARSERAVPRHSIAVLPFTDMSAEGDQAYMGDGVAEEILNASLEPRHESWSEWTGSLTPAHPHQHIFAGPRELVLESTSPISCTAPRVRRTGPHVHLFGWLLCWPWKDAICGASPFFC